MKLHVLCSNRRNILIYRIVAKKKLIYKSFLQQTPLKKKKKTMHPNLLNKWNEVIPGPFLIYQSLNINRHYHIQTKWPKFKQEKTQKQEELQGKFQALPRWDMNLWMWRKPKPKKRIYRHKYQKELKQYKKFIILMIARENNESRQKIELITKWTVQFIKAAKHKHKKIKIKN